MKKCKIGYQKIVTGAFGIAVLFFAGCGSGSSTSSDTAAVTEQYVTDDIYTNEYASETAMEEAPMEETAAESSNVHVASNRKLIKNVNLNVETEEFDELCQNVNSKVEMLGGYIENMNLYNGSAMYGETNRNVSMTIRIPKEKLDGFVSGVAEISNVISRTESTQDVTMQYVDLESHKIALITEQERLLELLQVAESMEDIVVLEGRLSEIRYELESMESQLRTYDNLVDFSTVYLEIAEVERLTPVEETSSLDRMTDGFINSVGNLLKGIKNFLVWLVICLPYIIFWAAIGMIIALIIRWIKKRNMKKNPNDKKRYGLHDHVTNAYVPYGYGNCMNDNEKIIVNQNNVPTEVPQMESSSDNGTKSKETEISK